MFLDLYLLTFSMVIIFFWLFDMLSNALKWLICMFYHVKAKTATNDTLEKGLQQPLLITSEEKQEDDEDPEGDGSEEASEESRQPATSIASAYRLLTPSVKVYD